MDIVWYILGALAIATGSLDVFFTVLAYGSQGLIVERGYKPAWRLCRQVAVHLPEPASSFVRSVAAPLMVLCTIATWMAFQVVGFALVDYPAIKGQGFTLHDLPHSFLTSLYFSAATIGSLSYSDAQPLGTTMHIVAAVETLIGFGVLTLAVTYIIGLYSVVQRQAALWINLQHHAEGNQGASNLLAPHFHDGMVDGLSTLLREMHHDLTSYVEGLRRYPLVYYFHIRQQYRSLPHLMWTIGEVASAVRWGLPSGHPASKDPWLPGLLAGYRQAMSDIESRFIWEPPPALETGVDHETFILDRRQHRSGNPLVSEFLELELLMARLADLRISADDEEAYERYKAWRGLAVTHRAFIFAISNDFGVDNTLITGYGEEAASAP